ncbi:MAG: hypothetical protein V4577_20370 [Bacteroidota bacterium]
MRTLKTLIAVLAIAVVTTATSCKKNNDDNVKPKASFNRPDMNRPMPQDSSGGEDHPTHPHQP